MRFSKIFEPKCLDDIVGQEHLVGSDGIFRKFLASSAFPNIFLFGPPGCGKTSMAIILAKETNSDFYSLNGASFKTEEIRDIAKRYNNALAKAVIFIDEVHRLSKVQQEAILAIMEKSNIRIFGASTENPFFAMTPAVRSRAFVFELMQINDSDMLKLINKFETHFEIKIEDNSKNYILKSSNGDIRSLLNLLEYGYGLDKNLSYETVKALRPFRQTSNSNTDTAHYDLTSGMIKSIRASEIQKSLVFFAKLLNCGEDVVFIARRLVIFASEDIGNANPNALNLAVSAMQAVSKIGMPEARIILSQVIIYLSSCPKSNSSYLAIDNAIEAHKNGDIYIDEIFYRPELIGFEKTLDEWHKKIKG